MNGSDSLIIFALIANERVMHSFSMCCVSMRTRPSPSNVYSDWSHLSHECANSGKSFDADVTTLHQIEFEFMNLNRIQAEQTLLTE